MEVPLALLEDLQSEGDLHVFDLPLIPLGKSRGSIQFVLSLKKWTTHHVPPNISMSPRNSA